MRHPLAASARLLPTSLAVTSNLRSARGAKPIDFILAQPREGRHATLLQLKPRASGAAPNARDKLPRRYAATDELSTGGPLTRGQLERDVRPPLSAGLITLCFMTALSGALTLPISRRAHNAATRKF